MSDRQHENAVTSMVEEHYDFLYRFAYRLSGRTQDAEDLTQQTFLLAQRHCAQLRHPEKARGWLVSILRNAFRKSLRQRDFKTFDSYESLEPEVPVPDEMPLDPERLQIALGEMPEEYRTAVILFYLEDLSYKQIADVLEIPIGTVMSRLSRGKEFLRKVFAQEIALFRPVESDSGTY